jgi:ribonuclease HI
MGGCFSSQDREEHVYLLQQVARLQQELECGKQQNGQTQQGVESGQPTLAQFARTISDAAQRKDEAFMRQVFKRHATNEKLSASALIAALKDVAAPLLSATSSESSSDSADFVFRRADANMSGDIDFSE